MSDYQPQLIKSVGENGMIAYETRPYTESDLAESEQLAKQYTKEVLTKYWLDALDESTKNQIKVNATRNPAFKFHLNDTLKDLLAQYQKGLISNPRTRSHIETHLLKTLEGEIIMATLSVKENSGNK